MSEVNYSMKANRLPQAFIPIFGTSEIKSSSDVIREITNTLNSDDISKIKSISHTYNSESKAIWHLQREEVFP